MLGFERTDYSYQSLGEIMTVAKNALSPLGRKIFLDRYALKDAKKDTLAIGDLVVAVSNTQTGQREIGSVISLSGES